MLKKTAEENGEELKIMIKQSESRGQQDIKTEFMQQNKVQ